MDIENIIQHIIDNGKIDDMQELSNMLEDSMEIIKDFDEKCYKHLEIKLYELAYGERLTDEIKTEWVKKMRPLAKWNIEEIEEINSRYNLNIPIYSIYVIMNMLYTDMKNVLGSGDDEESIEKYIQATTDWYYDEDVSNAQESKLYCYWKNIVN